MAGQNGVLLIIVTVLMLAGGVGRAAIPNDGAGQILRIEKALAAAQNVGQVAPYLDPDFVWDDVVPGRWRGVVAAKAHFAAEFGAVKDLNTTIMAISVDADDRLGFAYSTQHISFTAVPSNQRVDFITRQTDCYHRVGKTWLMVYQHVSFPVDFATGKAVLSESLAPKSGGF
jgi:ketosteroid isomerase-like protein